MKTASAEHEKQIALMKWLSKLTRALHGPTPKLVGDHIYVVGGAVRNYKLQAPIKDLDIVIDSVALGGLDSEWFAKELARKIPAPTSLTTNQYGVAILAVKGDWWIDGINLAGEVIEIANARKESYGGLESPGKGYKPTEVEPATIHEDVVRREFTFNSLLWRLSELASGPDKAEIIDLTGCGLRDLQQGEMRCPSDPDKTFSDDPSRMLRAFKFMLKYHFKIPPDVKQAIQRNAPKLAHIPHEAVSKLLIETILSDRKVLAALEDMKELGLLDVILDMMATVKPFRASLMHWMNDQPTSTRLALIKVGFPAPPSVSWLGDKGLARFEDVTESMSQQEAQDFLDVLKQPGKVLDIKGLAEELGLKGAQIAPVTEHARTLLLMHPEWANAPQRLYSAIRDRLQGGRLASASKVAKRYLRADLTPALGYEDNVLTTRIRQEVKNPKTQADLLTKVQMGRDLDQGDERVLYRKPHNEKGPNDTVKSIVISTHAQYRMDLRGIVVPELRLTLRHFISQMKIWENKKDPRFLEFAQELKAGRKVRWEDGDLANSGGSPLFTVFKNVRPGVLEIVTAYWRGDNDGTVKMASRRLRGKLGTICLLG